MAEEPSINISGGPAGGGEPARFEPGTAETRAEAVVDLLGELYWRKSYGGQAAFTCLVRTILSQNTSDVASQPAHEALLERYGGGNSGSQPSAEREGDGEGNDDADLMEALARADHATLAEVIRPAGLYNQKATVIIEAAKELSTAFGSARAFDEYVTRSDPAEVRDRLLSLSGVGPKTADCVLLFAGGRNGVFPVDTHVHRIYRRMGIAPPDADHETVRTILERDVPAEKCGFGHTASIQFGREYCTARSPACLDGPEACPAVEHCEQIGVDEVSGTVVDPAEASPPTE